MSYVYSHNRRGMGQVAEIITGIVGPLAEGGSAAYATYSQERIAKKDLAARRKETQALLEQRQREIEAQAIQQQQRMRVEALRRQQTGFAVSENVKLALGVVALLGVTAIVFRPRRKR